VSEPREAWLEWQRQHAEALAALQDAQRAYHRTVVERALASRRHSGAGSLSSVVDGQQSVAGQQRAADRTQSTTGPSSNASPATSATNVQQALAAVDAARVRLDAVRARKPE
jgi:hypothetical protein